MRMKSVTMQPLFASRLDPVGERLAMALSNIKPLDAAPASGIVIPETRSHKQRNFAFCRNIDCAEEGMEFRFEVENTLVPCPKCGATEAPFVGMLAKTHLLVRDKLGHIKGMGGIRYRIACDTDNKRHTISTLHNHELATGDRKIANCIDCLAQADRLNAGSTGSTLQFAQ